MAGLPHYCANLQDGIPCTCTNKDELTTYQLCMRLAEEHLAQRNANKPLPLEIEQLQESIRRLQQMLAARALLLHEGDEVEQSAALRFYNVVAAKLDEKRARLAEIYDSDAPESELIDLRYLSRYASLM